MEMAVIRKLIKYSCILMLATNVFAGGDDREGQDQVTLEEEIAAFEAELAQDLANQAALSEIAEFEATLAEELANQSQVEYDIKVAELMEQLAQEKELADFEAQLEAELAAQEMMAEIVAEEERAKRLAEFLAKLEAEKAAAARSTAIYQARLQQEQIIKDNQAKRAAKLAEEAEKQ